MLRLESCTNLSCHFRSRTILSYNRGLTTSNYHTNEQRKTRQMGVSQMSLVDPIGNKTSHRYLRLIRMLIRSYCCSTFLNRSICLQGFRKEELWLSRVSEGLAWAKIEIDIRQSNNTSLHPSLHPSTHPTINPLISPDINPSIDQSIHRFIDPSSHRSIRPSIHPAIDPSSHRCSHQFIHQPIHLFLGTSNYPYINATNQSILHIASNDTLLYFSDLLRCVSSMCAIAATSQLPVALAVKLGHKANPPSCA